MSKILLILSVSLIFLTLFPQYGRAQGRDNGENLSLFIVGNSFSNNATHYLDTIAKENGYVISIGRAEIGGGSLEQHWKAAETFEYDSLSPAGRPYNGKSLKMLLNEGKWKIVTLQQYSFLSSDSVSYIPYLKKLCHYIKMAQPEAEILLHQTWAYRRDSPGFSMIGVSVPARGQREMWEKSRKMYHHYASLLGLRIIPVGDAFWSVDSDKRDGYKKDPVYNFDIPVYPQLPDQKNSLHVGYFWDQNQRFSFDSNHANDAGCFLGSLVWYATLFERSPRKVRFQPSDLSPTFAGRLRREASNAVKGELNNRRKSRNRIMKSVRSKLSLKAVK
jgi:hypothetical protein